MVGSLNFFPVSPLRDVGFHVSLVTSLASHHCAFFCRHTSTLLSASWRTLRSWPSIRGLLLCSSRQVCTKTPMKTFASHLPRMSFAPAYFIFVHEARSHPVPIRLLLALALSLGSDTQQKIICFPLGQTSDSLKYGYRFSIKAPGI